MMRSAVAVRIDRKEWMSQTLGKRMHDVRKLRGLSLAQTASAAGISAAYVQKLERGDVAAPSPHKLRELARVLAVSYTDLMRLAGYAVADDGEDVPSARQNSSVRVLAHALQTEDLSADELGELADYLALRRRQRDREAPGA
jgi:HTH-type transcriptional regulator, competence development regulator